MIPKRLLIATLVMISPATVAAQDPSLERVEAAIDRGATADARAELDAWWVRNGAAASRIPARTRARAIFLRAELSADPRRAQDDYLTVALDFPTAPEAGAALLRGAQALALRGEAERARTYLERLRRDYPGGEHRAAGLLWLARVRRTTGNGDACEAVDAGLQAAANDEEVRSLLDAEKSLCARTAGTPAPTATGRPATAPAAAPAQPTGNYAVQIGAFRSAQSANALAARLRELGFDSRIVTVPGNALLRVRVGRFDGVTPARELLRQLADRNVDGVIVVDANTESIAE